MKAEDFIQLFLPEFVFRNFEAVKYDSKDDCINIYLDEKNIKPHEGLFISKGFTASKTIQDFPIRGKRVYLYIRRRKWLDIRTNEVVTRKYDLNHQGTDLTHEFVAFLKATN